MKFCKSGVMKKSLIALMVCTLVVLKADVTSDETQKGIGDYLDGLFAIGARVKTPLYTNERVKSDVAPYIFGSVASVSVEGNRADLTLSGNGRVYAAISAQYHSLFQRDATALYDEREATIEMGVTVGVRLPHRFVVRGTLYQDVLQRHNGRELDLQLFRHDTLGGWFFVTMVAMQWHSSEFSQYYFATPSYSPKQSYSAEFEMIATYYVKQVGFFIGTRNFWYAKSVANSSIVQQPYNLQGFSGIGYRF